MNNEKHNIIKEKSYQFAVRIVKLYQHLTGSKKEFVIAKQLLRSGTSIGANVHEAIGGVSKKDFSNKMSIAYKEALETKYWLQLLKDTDYLREKEFISMHTDADELCSILYSIIRSAKKGNT